MTGVSFFAGGRNDYGIYFKVMTESEAVNRIKTSDLNQDSGQLWGKWVTIVMENNTPETTSRHKQYNGNIERSKQYYQDSKERLQKMNQDQCRGLPGKKKIKEESIREINIGFKKSILEYVWWKLTKTKRIWKKTILHYASSRQTENERLHERIQ